MVTTTVEVRIPSDVDQAMLALAGKVAAGHHAELDFDTDVLSVQVPEDNVEGYTAAIAARFGVVTAAPSSN
ncbi:hypothetical protein COW94_04505 [Candidatus Peregrinibacteria bacterium CG22_combo_CG10-13_8_21_14_all_44_10]|nr:MAG: hypothetical protein AUK45_03710 [Candidatus Peregrinibacteria bacterium CG2_30_44_17]PIP65909.1 MAG: hypothetical protein COW94_04505 [Candidatus Peregrinibacteria bacterium CG22_combo_CG10-13_8_21_14_all_44_10]PIS04423.1 MAG: hypothetical protein COT83_00610 [Candidatus Peregrinibacteria bacterium CG10_big_fil_rev_8_21_14_0_10_44_7]PIX79759.1 MAG: hypothetical protein COZ35_02730 [Candidatus Peregrinibacteria bacterium CG_4_10_14_3_um_filter_44_21]PJB88365.1 MAG: hypothetical protein 